MNRIEIGARHDDEGRWVDEDGDPAGILAVGMIVEVVRHGHIRLSLGNRYEVQDMVLRQAEIDKLARFLDQRRTK